MVDTRTYTEAVLDFSDRMDVVEQRLSAKLDKIVDTNAEMKAALAKGDVRFSAMNEKIDAGFTAIGLRIDDCDKHTAANAGEITKVRNLNATLTAVFSGIAAFVGYQR